MRANRRPKRPAQAGQQAALVRPLEHVHNQAGRHDQHQHLDNALDRPFVDQLATIEHKANRHQREQDEDLLGN